MFCASTSRSEYGTHYLVRLRTVTKLSIHVFIKVFIYQLMHKRVAVKEY